MGRFDGKRIIVTGGTSGIGKATAIAFLNEGAQVFIVGSDKDKVLKTCNELKHTALVGLHQDLERTENIAIFFKKLVKDKGSFDVLVNSAGVSHFCPATEESIENFQRTMKINVEAPYILSREFARQKTSLAKRAIVNVESLMSFQSRPGMSTYAISKGAIHQMTQSLALDFVSLGIRVNGVAPGYVDTPMVAEMKQVPELDQWVKDRTPLNRWAEPQEIAKAILFLASEEASYMTGETIRVDGGTLASF
ncbi:MAG: SDR family oxidoreductase [Lentisphaeria bacterium]|nr:SDR family oxidoreductase [Lentisphaeria bacterium]